MSELEALLSQLQYVSHGPGPPRMLSGFQCSADLCTLSVLKLIRTGRQATTVAFKKWSQ